MGKKKVQAADDDDALLDAAIAANAISPVSAVPAAAPRGRQRISVEACRQLLEAVTMQDAPRVLKLLQQGASANFADKKLVGGRPGNQVPLHLSAGCNASLAITRALLDAKAEVNCQRVDGDTPLFKSAQYGNADCMEELLSRGGDPHRAQEKGITPLAIAVQGSHRACVAALARAGVDVDTPLGENGWTPLALASYRGDLAFALTCLEVGARVDRTVGCGATPLFVAAQCGFARIVRILLDHRADPSFPRADGHTPLRECCEGVCNVDEWYTNAVATNAVVDLERPNHTKCLLALLAAGVAIPPDALHIACPTLIATLLEAGADVNSAVEVDDAMDAARSNSFPRPV